MVTGEDLDLDKKILLQMHDGTYRQVGVPQFLYFKCDVCKRYKQIARLRPEIAKVGPHKGERQVVGYCTKCGKEIATSINTQQERDELVQRSIYYWQKDQNDQKASIQKREQRGNSKGSSKKMPKTTVVKKIKTTAASKAPVQTKVASKGATKASANGLRTHVWDIPEGAANGTVTLAMIAAGGPWTVEELNERHDALAKTGKTARRTRPLTTSDFTWLVKHGEVKVGDAEHQAYRGRNADDDDVFTVPTLADPLKKGSRAGKITKSGSKMIFNGITITKDRMAVETKKSPATMARRTSTKTTKTTKK